MPDYRTPFDPPVEEEAKRQPPPEESFDPNERVKRAFQGLRVADRTMDSPMSWLVSGNVFPSPWEPLRSEYLAPIDRGLPRAQTPINYLDVFNPLSTALGAVDLENAFDKKMDDVIKVYTLKEAEAKKKSKR